MEQIIKNLFLGVLFIFLTVSCGKFEDDFFDLTAVPPLFPKENWVKTGNPERFGWKIEALDDVRDYAKEMKSEALMIVDRGKLIAAYGDTDKKYYVASVRKSYLSLLYGFYVDSLISLDATLLDYAIDDKNPALNNQEKSATVKHLLTSSSGIYHESAANSDNDGLPARNSNIPGERFYYNNWDFNALGTIFSKRTNKNIFEDFHIRIASKIGLEDFEWQRDGRLDYSDVSEHPAYHFDMTCRDMARIGLLMLNKGKWENEQVVPLEWAIESTSPQVSVGEEFGNGSYGYMWWMMDNDEFESTGLSRLSFSAQGNWSQLIIIDPVNEIVIVHRAFKRKIDANKLLVLLKKIVSARA